MKNTSWLWAWLLVFVVLFGFSPNGGAQDETSIFDLVTECDLLAAHPDDPQRMAEGVADDEIVPRLAIMACTQALNDGVSDTRIAFQLGRAYLAADEERDAARYLSDAANKNHAAAAAYMGDLYQFGLGVPVDPERALGFYRKAVRQGFNAAEAQIEQLTFDASLFVSGAIESFYTEEFSTIATQLQDLKIRNYVYNLSLLLMEECEPFLTPDSLVRFYFFRYPKNWKIEQEDDILIAIQTSIGERDAGVFLRRHGCDGPVAKRLFASLNRFFGTWDPKS